ncbi:hypothetical protein BDN67DRAFT_974185 [Paxillus ammoniavirescens]|nr:hypothetical protein BDN67DRAFT_974185 [Paxillus ammoniavirescens]
MYAASPDRSDNVSIDPPQTQPSMKYAVASFDDAGLRWIIFTQRPSDLRKVSERRTSRLLYDF